MFDPGGMRQGRTRALVSYQARSDVLTDMGKGRLRDRGPANCRDYAGKVQPAGRMSMR